MQKQKLPQMEKKALAPLLEKSPGKAGWKLRLTGFPQG
jgi:hypothetical protein